MIVVFSGLGSQVRRLFATAFAAVPTIKSLPWNV
jgi:hypothetical protein